MTLGWKTMPTPRDLDATEYAALIDYAREFGAKWKDSLKGDWYHARTRGTGDRGAILHGLRNDPRWAHEGLDLFDAELPNILHTCPLYKNSQAPGDESAAKWSGDTTPPAIGWTVKLYGSGRTAKVLGYFIEGGWLGVLVKTLDPAGDLGCVFGAEIEVLA